MPPRQAASESMQELFGALIATSRHFYKPHTLGGASRTRSVSSSAHEEVTGEAIRHHRSESIGN